MAGNGDSRPFVALRQSAEDFRSAFNDDIKSCADTLDAKLTSLMCDPDSIGSPSRDMNRLSANFEFSKAKYEIFMSMESLLNEMESSWKEQLTILKNSFLENVEILLASTKLEANFSKTGKKAHTPVSKNSKGQLDSLSSITSSIHPFSLLNTAKKIPVLNSLLPKAEEIDDIIKMNSLSSTSTSRRSSYQHAKMITVEEDETSEEDNEVPVSKTPLKRKQMRKSFTTPLAVEEAPVKPSLLRRRTVVVMEKPAKSLSRRNAVVKETMQNDERMDEEETSEEDNEAEVVTMPLKSGRQMRKLVNVPHSVEKVPAKPLARRATEVKETIQNDAITLTPSKRKAGKGRKSILKIDPANESELHTTPSRSTRKRTAVKETVQTESIIEMECSESDFETTSAAQKTPKNVHFSVGLDVHEDLEIYSPEVNLTRSAPRRKTMIPPTSDSFSDVNLTPNVRSKTKRKTIGGGVMDVSVAPSPKRFKRGSRASSTTILEEPEESDHLESDESSVTEHYTPWLPLDNLDGKVPAEPGIYELKVYKAKKSAYIGSSDNLRQKLTLHKLGQNSGHKHLDKFIERNKKDVQVRYEKVPTTVHAKNEEMSRIKAFVEQHKTTPAYN